MAGLRNAVSKLAGTAGGVSRRRGTGTPAVGGMGRRRTGLGGPTPGGTATGAAGGLLSKLKKRR